LQDLKDKEAREMFRPQIGWKSRDLAAGKKPVSLVRFLGSCT